jgi:hypothetical protein
MGRKRNLGSGFGFRVPGFAAGRPLLSSINWTIRPEPGTRNLRPGTETQDRFCSPLDRTAMLSERFARVRYEPIPFARALEKPCDGIG